MPNDPIRAALQVAAQEVGAQVRSPDSARGDVARTAIVVFLDALADRMAVDQALILPPSGIFASQLRALADSIERTADAAEARKARG